MNPLKSTYFCQAFYIYPPFFRGVTAVESLLKILSGRGGSFHWGFKVSGTGAEVSRSRKMITILNRRVLTDKIFLVLIVVALVVAILVIVYYRWIKPIFA